MAWESLAHQVIHSLSNSRVVNIVEPISGKSTAATFMLWLVKRTNPIQGSNFGSCTLLPLLAEDVTSVGDDVALTLLPTNADRRKKGSAPYNSRKKCKRSIPPQDILWWRGPFFRSSTVVTFMLQFDTVSQLQK